MKQLIWKVRQLVSTDLVRVSFFNGLSTLVKMLSGIVSVKVVANIVGPSGMALLGQLTNFTTIVQSLAGGGITTGVTRYVSEQAKNEEKIAVYIGSAFRITVVLSVLTGMLLIGFSSRFSQLIFASEAFNLVFVIFGCTLIFYALNALLLAILNGFKAYRSFVRINVAGSFISLVFSVMLAWIFGLQGALVALVTYQSVVFLVTLYLIYTSPWFTYALFFRSYSGKAASNLFRYSIMALTSALVVPLSQLLVRGHIVDTTSASDAGMWEGMNRISGMYLQAVIGSLGVYYLPKLAELQTEKEIRQEVWNVYQLMLPFLILAAMVIYVIRQPLISMLFTEAFIPMELLFPFQLAGDVLKMSGWILGYIMVAKAMIRTYILTEVMNYSLFVFLSYWLVDIYGVNGAVIAYATGHAVYLFSMLWIFRRLLFSRRDRD